MPVIVDDTRSSKIKSFPSQTIFLSWQASNTLTFHLCELTMCESNEHIKLVRK